MDTITLKMTAKNYGYGSTESFLAFIRRLCSRKTTIYMANGEKVAAGDLLAA